MMILMPSESPLQFLRRLENAKVFVVVNISLGDVHKLSAKDVEKYYVRYQTITTTHEARMRRLVKSIRTTPNLNVLTSS